MASFISKLTSSFSLAGIKKIVADVITVVQNFTKVFTKISGVVESVLHLIQSVKDEIEGFKNFRQDLRFKSRVVNLESAITKTRDLILGIPATWRAVLDLFSQIRSAIAKDVAAEEGAAILAVETAGLSEVVVGLTVVYQIASFVESVISDLQTIVDEISRFRKEIEKLDSIFLTQSNKRKRVKLEDGSTMLIRVGKLHAA
jgi:hypothetical protein